MGGSAQNASRAVNISGWPGAVPRTGKNVSGLKLARTVKGLARPIKHGRPRWDTWLRSIGIEERTGMVHLLAAHEDANLMIRLEIVGAAMGLLPEVVTPGEFQAAYQRLRPGIVVFDTVMPTIDGVELANWLGQQRFRGCAIILSDKNPWYSKAARTLLESRGEARVLTSGGTPDNDELREILAQAILHLQAMPQSRHGDDDDEGSCKNLG